MSPLLNLLPTNPRLPIFTLFTSFTHTTTALPLVRQTGKQCYLKCAAELRLLAAAAAAASHTTALLLLPGTTS